MQPCLDDPTILAFGNGDVDPATKERVQAHIAECDECRALVLQVVRSSSMIPMAKRADAPPDSEPPPVPPPPKKPADLPPFSVISAPQPSAPPPPANRVVIALAVIIVLIGTGAGVTLAFAH